MNVVYSHKTQSSLLLFTLNHVTVATPTLAERKWKPRYDLSLKRVRRLHRGGPRGVQALRTKVGNLNACSLRYKLCDVMWSVWSLPVLSCLLPVDCLCLQQQKLSVRLKNLFYYIIVFVWSHIFIYIFIFGILLLFDLVCKKKQKNNQISHVWN